MSALGPPEEANAPRDPQLEAAFTHWVQQAQAPSAFAARVRARAQRQRTARWPQVWRWRLGPWWGAGGPWSGSEAPQRARWVWVGVLVPCLVLSVLGNIWLGVQLVKQAQVARTTKVPPPAGSAPQGSHQPSSTRSVQQASTPPPAGSVPQEPSGWVQLAFVDTVREQELRALLLSLRATIMRGPSPQGLYLVQVPLTRLRLRGAEEPTTADPLHQLVEELRAHPAVRLAEPVSPAN